MHGGTRYAEIFSGQPEWLALHHRVKRPARRSFVRSLDIPAGSLVLDVGSGSGGWADEVESLTEAHVVALDQLPTRALSATAPDRRLGVLAEMGQMPFARSSFDFVLLFNVLYLVADPALVIRGCVDLLRPGGKLVARNFDDGLLLPFGLDPVALNGIRTALEHHAEALPQEPSGMFGRQLPALCSTAIAEHGGGVALASVGQDVATLIAPYSLDEIAYLRANHSFVADAIVPWASEAERDAWAGLLDPSGCPVSPAWSFGDVCCILERDGEGRNRADASGS